MTKSPTPEDNQPVDPERPPVDSADEAVPDLSAPRPSAVDGSDVEFWDVDGWTPDEWSAGSESAPAERAQTADDADPDVPGGVEPLPETGHDQETAHHDVDDPAHAPDLTRTDPAPDPDAASATTAPAAPASIESADPGSDAARATSPDGHDEVPTEAERPAATGNAAPEPTGESGPVSGWVTLGRAIRPRATRSQVLAGLLCALLGFALAVQVSQTQEQQLSSLRQSDLVRLLDDVTQRANELESRVSDLQDTRDELKSGSGQQRAALELAQRQSDTQGILSGRLPAEGPGITLTITERGERLSASKLFNILEELRNAGVEVVEINGVRLVTSSYFEETTGGMVVDGQKISSPYRWSAVGDPSTLETALEIPGGAMATVRNAGAETSITQEELVTIESVREPAAPRFATPVPAEDAG